MLDPNKPPKAVNIWKSYMCTAVEETSVESIFAVMIFIYLQPLFTTWKVYWPAPSSFVGSVGRALHWYRRGHGFKSRTGLTFLYFQKFWKCSLYQWKLWFFYALEKQHRLEWHRNWPWVSRKSNFHRRNSKLHPNCVSNKAQPLPDLHRLQLRLFLVQF